MPRLSDPDSSGPSSPEALARLVICLDGFDSATKAKGRAILSNRLITETWIDDQVIAGQVLGSAPAPYVATLQLEGRDWVSECECPVGQRCKHAHALGLFWLREHRVSSVPSASRLPATPPPAPDPSVAPKTKRPFREVWAPVLAEKIGRPLTDEEARLLGRLSALFSDMRQANGRLTKGDWRKHGFGDAPSANRYVYGYYEEVMPGWWNPRQPPEDPWALWQYVAYKWEHEGRPLPEALRPMTDLAKVRASIGQKILHDELEVWRRTFSAPSLEIETASAASSPQTRDELAKAVDFRLRIQPDARVLLEIRPLKPKPRQEWTPPTQKWIKALLAAFPADTAAFSPAARRIALLLRLSAANRGGYGQIYFGRDAELPREHVRPLCDDAECHPALLLPDGTAYRVETEPLLLTARPLPEDPDRLGLELSAPDGRVLADWPRNFSPAGPDVYLVGARLHPGPPRPPLARLPVAALADPAIAPRLRELRVRLPDSLEARFRDVPLRPRLRVALRESAHDPAPVLLLRLEAVSDEPPCAQEWRARDGWAWLPGASPPAARPEDPHLRFNLDAANAVGARFADLRVVWWESEEAWTRPAGRAFPDDFLAWRDSLPPGVEVLLAPELRSLAENPLRARYSVEAAPAEGSGRDWFDVSVELKPEDLTLSPEEIRLLLKARGSWVRLPGRGWQRIELAEDPAAVENLARLGLAADPDALLSGRAVHRYHALQLAAAPLDDAALAASLRARAESLRAIPPPPLPAGLRAELRPYQLEGYHFLAHLSALGLGGVLADDMGLGKTLQTLAWLLRLSEEISNFKSEISNGAEGARAFRALVVCPKSVVPNWRNETARFAPALRTATLDDPAPADSSAAAAPSLLVVNYAQLRLRADALAAEPWDAVVLDEGQNIKNPASATARAACALRAAHRVVLSGTPVENRLLDLWSLLAFAQPGLLGTQASFQRLYNEKTDPAGARSRLAARVRPFLLRRTKSQVAKDLPARIEEEIECELEGPQRALYDAELKRARQMLLAVKSARQFDAQRFNILQSLLRLRQICCDPRLLLAEETPAPKKGGRPRKNAAVAAPPESAPGAKLEALLDTLEPLVAEGHRVLVFSQFTRMLDLIAEELRAREIAHLLLTGQTENRQELVERFQSAEGPPVFLLSLKAAGAGLNLTAASYVVLFDPWWNPAVEAQAIDRTHRIGQANTVIAYRLIARDTVEQKIRALQREKASLAAAVVQEENLAAVLDLENLRRILT